MKNEKTESERLNALPMDSYLRKMTHEENAERLRTYYLTHDARKNKKNICTGRPNWNGCDYCDFYSGGGGECWKQDGAHTCIRCFEMDISKK